MKQFLDDNFILQTKTAERLYHDYAKGMPIIDYHSHLIPSQIAENKQFENITQAWLYGDHYKWRAMRTNGIKEQFITGHASDEEKFNAWAETVPNTLRNPLYHWTHLELKAYFGITDLLSPSTASKIYGKTKELMVTPEYSVQGLIKKQNVKVICTTDDPIDSLEHHKAIKEQGADVKVLPTWRPDKAMAIDDVPAYNEYLSKLEELTGVSINIFGDLIEALSIRQDFFHEQGCRLSDHGLDYFIAEPYTQNEVDAYFMLLRQGDSITGEEKLKFKSAVIHELALLNHRKGWVQQFHVGALRNNNQRMHRTIGPDTGFDSIADYPQAQAMSRFLNRLDNTDQLAKTIVYNLNPADNEVFATMIGNFQDGSVAGKIQWGSGWWFLDQKDGMEKQMNALSNLGLLSRFVGMLTDSRSFLSFPRHEYFRRILCNLLGNDVEMGLVPNDMELLGTMVENICYNNANEYFGF